MNRKIVAGVILLDAAVLVHLAGGVFGAVVFVIFLGAFLLPATVLITRLPYVRTLPADLRLVSAGVLVVVLVVPWFFVRKVLPFAPGITDVTICVILTAAALKLGGLRTTIEELTPAWRRSRWFVSIVLPVIFAIAWLGYGALTGNDVRFQGLFAIDFGNLVAILSTVRASPLLPLAHVTDMGPLSYHWLYFTLPGMLTDFCGASIPACNALVLVNLLMASLLIHTLATVIAVIQPERDRRTPTVAAGIVLFAPFTLYYYQAIAARIPLGWLAMPIRNHLVLSPVNSMIVFGNNTMALVLALVTAVQVERWNRERRIPDLILGTAALSMVIGYSITLLFPLVAALLIWLVAGRIARPLLVLVCAAISGGAAVGIFMAIHVLSSGDSRHATFAFDGGQFLRIVILGMLPLWGLLVLARRQAITFFHVLILTAIVVPSCLYIAGSTTGQIDFSIKTGSLLAIAFAPLIALTVERAFGGGLARWELIAATILVAMGLLQTSAYVLQFPYYRVTHSESRGGMTIPGDYYRSLVWIRDHTPRSAIIVDPGGLTMATALPVTWIAERRGWLATPYTEAAFVMPPNSPVPLRAALWETFMHDPANPAAAGRIAREADYLLIDREIRSPFWDPVTRSGSWIIYHSRAH